jgi:hypothetical protein
MSNSFPAKRGSKLTAELSATCKIWNAQKHAKVHIKYSPKTYLIVTMQNLESLLFHETQRLRNVPEELIARVTVQNQNRD